MFREVVVVYPVHLRILQKVRGNAEFRKLERVGYSTRIIHFGRKMLSVRHFFTHHKNFNHYYRWDMYFRSHIKQ